MAAGPLATFRRKQVQITATLGVLLSVALSGAVPLRKVSPGSVAVSRKFGLIENGRLRAGSRIDFTAGELTDWTREQAAVCFPGAIRNLRWDFSANAATAYADIDFVKLRQATTGEEPGWLMRNLFSGERGVVVKAHLASAAGRARVDLEAVQISGVSIGGRALDLLISDYVRPNFPEVKVAEWFPLADRVDRVILTRSGASVFIGR
jgi:hypothetical protein